MAMKFENAAEAFKAVEALALDPNNEDIFGWLADAMVTHANTEIRKAQDRILRRERFGPPQKAQDQLHWLARYEKMLEIAETLREWITWSNAENSAPAAVAAIMAKYAKPDIQTTGRETKPLAGKAKKK